MAGVSEGIDRGQSTRFPERLVDWVGEDQLVRVIDLFVEELELSCLGFERATAARTGRLGCHPAVLLKLFIYGYLNRVPTSRRLERKSGREVELMWLTGRRVPEPQDHLKTRRSSARGLPWLLGSEGSAKRSQPIHLLVRLPDARSSEEESCL